MTDFHQMERQVREIRDRLRDRMTGADVDLRLHLSRVDASLSEAAVRLDICAGRYDQKPKADK